MASVILLGILLTNLNLSNFRFVIGVCVVFIK